MNIDTGHIVTQAELEQMQAEAREAYRPVPAGLSRQARRLHERQQHADLKSGGLAKFARAERKKRRQAAKASRRRNRGR